MSLRGTPPGAAVEVLGEWRTLLQPLLSGTPEPLGDSLGRIASTTDVILRSPHSVIAVVDEAEELQFFASPDAEAAPTAALQRFAASAEARTGVLGHGAPVRTADPTQDTELSAAPPGLGAVLAVPIRYEGRIVGGLYLGRAPDAKPFGLQDEQLAELVAGAAAAVLRRTRLSVDFRWQQRWLTESAQLTRAVLSGEHGAPLRLIVERVQEMTQADVVAVVRPRPDGERFEVVEALGPIDAYARDGLVDVSSAVLTRLSGPGPGLERATLALFPRSSGRAFTAAEIEATATLADQMSVAMNLAQSRSDRERLRLLDERDRIARDLHDHVIQRLFAIGLTVQSVAGQIGGDARDRLLGAVDGLDETIEQIRSTIYQLRGPVLPAPRSMPTRVAGLVHEMEAVFGFPAELEIRGPVEFGLDEEVSDDCVAVLREALTNVARHARATRVRVSLVAELEQLTLVVSDDGRGIGEAGRRSGLANMRARAERRQGTMSVGPGDGGGTRLTWTIPLGDSVAGSDPGQRAMTSSECG